MSRYCQKTICAVCGKEAISALRSRNICRTCYYDEEKISCPRCKSIVHSISAETGLCHRCTIATTWPIGICTSCSQTRPIYNVEESLCQHCHENFLRRKKPWQKCARCKISFKKLDEETGFCSRCMSPSAKPEGECTYCHRIRVIHDLDAKVCFPCYKNLSKQARDKNKSDRLKICSVCGELRVSQLSNRAICSPCLRKERNGYAQCTGCNAIKAVYNKGQQLCKLCYKNRRATRSLQNYLANYSIPYLYNNQLLALLVTTFDEKALTEDVNRQIRAFGQFLQTHHIAEPLTWQEIEELLASLKPTKRAKTRMVRASLLKLGHLMASKGLMESYETYIQKRGVQLNINQAPQHIQHTLQIHANWLCERKVSWSHLNGSPSSPVLQDVV